MIHGTTAMDFKRAISGLAIVFVVAALAGCTIKSSGPKSSLNLVDALSRTQSSDAFGAGKVFGIVSITAEPYISRVGGDGSISGALSALSSDKGFLENSQQVLEKSVPSVVSHMSRTTKYLLLPPSNVVTQSSYLQLPETTNNPFNLKNIARGYRKISHKKGLAMSAQSLGLDAAMHINIAYGFTQDTTNIGGLVEYGKYFATVKVNVIAVDESGKVIWKDSRANVSDRPVEANTQIGVAANFAKLEPFLIQSLRTALNDIVTRLEKS